MKLFSELKRRNVFRVAAGYAIISWLVLQVTDVVMGLLELPAWVGRFAFFAVLLGFPLALAFSWIFQLTPEGLRRDSELEPSDTVNLPTGRKLDLAIIVLLVTALGYFVVDKFVFPEPDMTTIREAPERFDRSIAVLPFVTSGEEEGGLLARGVHDDLLTQLSKVAELHVISRTSVMEYAETTKNLTQIGEELSVSHILEGGVQKIGNQVRINAQLIDARVDKHLWAETFDREFTVDNIFKVQSEIVRMITDSLHATLLAQTRASIETPPTGNMDAYRDYLAGLHSKRGRAVRIELLQSAVEKDPQFALAWGQLAHEWQQAFWFDPAQSDALEKAEEALGRAEAIDPDLPQLHWVRALIHYHGYVNYEAALRELDLAELRLPGDSGIFSLRATIYRHMQRIPEAIAEYRRAVELDPLSVGTQYELGIAYSLGRFYDLERVHWERQMTSFPEYTAVFAWLLSMVDWFQHGDSRSQLEVLYRPDWPKFSRHEALVALKHWQAGDMEDALQHARLIVPDERETNTIQPTYSDISRPFAELIQAGILIESGAEGEGRRILEDGRKRLSKEIVESGRPHWSKFSELGRFLSLLGERKAAEETAQAMVEAFDEAQRTYRLTGMHKDNGLIMCEIGELTEAEAEMRWVLSRPTGYTLASLVNDWPPCRRNFENTEHHQRLKEEFEHLSEGGPPKYLGSE